MKDISVISEPTKYLFIYVHIDLFFSLNHHDFNPKEKKYVYIYIDASLWAK